MTRIRHFAVWRLAASSAALAIGICAAGSAQSQESGTAVVGGISDIVVTAQRREQNLQEVPVSITALTSDMLEANRVQNVGDLNAIAPNLTVRQTAGGAGIPGITMRGALSIGVGPGADREVGFYVDGVYIGHAQGSMFDLADIQRIEVLRGPQGTLFGRNATAGAISIITQDPSGEFGLRQELTLGNYDHFRSKTRLDLPAFGPLSASVTYMHNERRGDVRNLGAGTVLDLRNGGKGFQTSPMWLGSENVESVQAAVKFVPSDDISFTYKFDWMDFQGTPNANGSSGLGVLSILGPLTPFFTQLLASQPNPSILTPFTKKRPDAVNNAYTTPNTMKVWGHNLTAQWQVNDSITLKNILAYRKVRSFTSYDLGGLGGLVITEEAAADPLFPFVYPGVSVGTPIIGAVSLVDYRHKQFSNELQMVVDIEPATITVGLLHYEQEQSNGGPPGLDNTFLLAPLAVGPTGAITFPVSQACLDPAVPASCGGAGPTKGTSQAAYIQVEAHLTDQLDLVGGFRITRDDKSGGFLTNNFEVKDTNESYLVGLNYKPTEDILLFAKYSTAFMSGGGNIGNFAPDILTYTPEFAYSWEGGVKADLFDRRLRTNISLFTVKYTGLQFLTSGQACGDNSAGICVYNAGEARAKGAEFEATAVPVDGLTLSAGVGYTDFKYTKLNPRATAATGFFQPHLRPKWTSNLAAQYDTQPFMGDTYLSLRLDANFRSTMRLTSEAPPELEDLVTTGSIWMLNGRIALSDLDFAGHKGELALWGRNLTNDKNMSWVNSYFFMYPTSYERARTFGVDLKFEW